jgi:hypothetical protein
MGFWDRLFGRKTPADAPGPAAAPPGAANEVPRVDPREHFLHQAETLLREDPAVEKVERHPEAYGLNVTRAGQHGSVFLENLFSETRELPPAERAHVLKRFLAQLWQEGPDQYTWEEARERLLPVLRTATFGMPQGNPSEPDPELVGRHSLPFCLELLVLDLPESTMFVQRRHLAEWGTDEDAAFAAAHANLAALGDAGVELYDTTPGPIWTVDTGDTYETSRLLRPGFLASFAGKVEGRPIAILPERSTLLIAGDAHPATVARLCESAEREYEAATRRLSPALYTVDDAGRVVPYLRPGNDALASRVRLAHVRFALGEYTAQKEALDRAHAARGEDIFVASLSALARNKDERPMTWCVWAHDVHALLPRSDVVAVSTGPKAFFMVTWAQVERLAPGCLVPEPGLWPPRFRTTTWPAPEALERLRAAAIDFENYDEP